MVFYTDALIGLDERTIKYYCRDMLRYDLTKEIITICMCGYDSGIAVISDQEQITTMYITI